MWRRAPTEASANASLSSGTYRGPAVLPLDHAAPSQFSQRVVTALTRV